MATATSSRRKQLLAHLEAAFLEIQRLSELFRTAIDRLEASTLSDLSPDGAAEWFRLYLRLVDLGVELRRGEQRHRSTRAVEFPCMHTTGTKGARHSGLSIDDANAIYQQLEATPGVKESQLEVYFMRMDALDRDGVGLLDVRLSACLATFLRRTSAFYARVEVTGSDPHQELLVYHHATNRVTKVTRSCFSASSCLCLPDAQPWVDFTLTPGVVTGSYDVVVDEDNDAAISAVASHALDSDIGLAELKRQYGFETTLPGEGDDEDALGDPMLHKRRRLGAVTSGARPPQPPREIYRRKCQERGLPRKRKVEELLVVRSGALELNLSQFGFHAPQDLQDVLDVVVEAQVPVRMVDVTNNFFDAKSFEIFCDLLRLPLLRDHLRTLNLRCMALPARPDFAALLRILTDTDAGSLSQLTTLDLSYNTFFEDAVLSLNDLLDGLTKLETLSLESCFPKAPDPGVVEVAVVKDLVRTALVSCCHRLKSLNFGSNWMSFPLLNSLFSPESALEELQLAQMTFFYFDAQDAAATAPISWKFSFMRQLKITLSETRHSRCEYLPFYLDALTYCLKMRIAQLQHLDLWILPPSQRKSDHMAPEIQLDDRVNGLLQALTEYGTLRTLRLRYDTHYNNTRCRLLMELLLQNGLAECESIDLALQAPVTLSELRGVLGRLHGPKLNTLRLSVTLRPSMDSDSAPLGEFARVFRGALAGLKELTLDFKVELKSSKSLLPDAAVQEMENAWRALGDGRKVSLVKRKAKKEREASANGRPRDMVTFAFLFSVSSS